MRFVGIWSWLLLWSLEIPIGPIEAYDKRLGRSESENGPVRNGNDDLSFSFGVGQRIMLSYPPTPNFDFEPFEFSNHVIRGVSSSQRSSCFGSVIAIGDAMKEPPKLLSAPPEVRRTPAA